jgi:hypothetical protein
MNQNQLIALAAHGKCELEVEDGGDASMSASSIELDDSDGAGEELSDLDRELSDLDRELSEADDSDQELSELLDDGGDGEETMDAIDGDPLDDDDEEFEPDDDEDEDEDEEEITDEAGHEPVTHGNDGTLPPVKEGREQMSAAPQAGRKAPVSLRSNDIGRNMKPTVDRAANAIRNVSVMQAGPAMGHGFVIDKKMLDQVREQVGKSGVPMRYTHPQKAAPDGEILPVDSLGTHVGKVTNVRDAGDELRGDIEFGPHAKHVPGMGDVSGYLMDLAEHDPSAFGLSTVFMPDDYERDAQGNPVGRSAGVVACDLTGEPASNRRGLL